MTIQNNEPRIAVRVFAARRIDFKSKSADKPGATKFVQDVQIDRADKAAVVHQIEFWNEEKVLPAGEYTAAFTVYKTRQTQKNGYETAALGIVLRDFKKA